MLSRWDLYISEASLCFVEWNSFKGPPNHYHNSHVSVQSCHQEGCPGPGRMIQVLRIHTSATRSLNIWQWCVYFFPQCVIPENNRVPPRGYINKLGGRELNTWRIQARLFVCHNERKSKALLRERGEDEQKQSPPACLWRHGFCRHALWLLGSLQARWHSAMKRYLQTESGWNYMVRLNKISPGADKSHRVTIL